MSSSDHDARLQAFLEARTDADAEGALAALFDAATERALADAVRRSLFGPAHRAADAEDVISETRLRLIRRLWALRRDGGAPIADFTAYVAATATRGCYAHLRARFPARTRLRNQVRYSVARHPGMVLEQVGGAWQCRSVALRAAPAAGAANEFLGAPSLFLSRHRIHPAQPLPHLVARLLSALDQPIELDRLVDALALALGVTEAVAAEHARADDDPLRRVADPSPDASRALGDREALERLWREVVDLPANQRAALLLNLRDPDGGSALHALPATGLVSMPALAASLGMDARALDELWDELPLDDQTIAARLGLSRQQVINLRKSARARLARRTET